MIVSFIHYEFTNLTAGTKNEFYTVKLIQELLNEVYGLYCGVYMKNTNTNNSRVYYKNVKMYKYKKNIKEIQI